MKAIKLLTQVKTYLPSIYRALAKYACKLYRKCTSQVLKQNSLLSGNFILIKTCLSSAFYATGFDRASGFHRLGTMKSRGPVDENSSGRRKWLEEKVKKDSPDTGIPLETYTNALKIGAKANPFDYVFNTRYIPSFNQIRTLFYLRPSLHRKCTVDVPPLHREKNGAGALQVLYNDSETYYKVKRRLKESPNKVRALYWTLLLIFIKNMFFQTVLDVRLVYGLFTNILLKWYQKGTEKLLGSYQIGTNGTSLRGNVHIANGQASAFTPFWRRALSQMGRFKGFNPLSGALMCFCNNNPFSGLKHLLNQVQEGVVYKELKNIRTYSLIVLMFFNLLDCFLMELKSIRTYSLLVLMVSMFSLSAQTPRKDSGADGLSHLVALKPGDRIPDAVWNQTLELNYFDGKKKTIKFSDLRGKLILLDFWSTTCPSCIENIPHMEEIQKRYQKEVAILLVNSKRNKDTRGRIKLVLDRYREKYNFEIKLPTILDDSFLTNLYPHNTIPNITWINQDGMFMGNTLPGEVGVRNIESILENKTAVLQLRSEFRNKSDGVATPPVFDTTGVKFLSAITGYLPYYLPTYPNVIHKNGNSNYQMVNAAFNFMLLNAFKRELEGFENTDYIFEVGLEDKVETMLSNGSSSENQYCYQLFVNDTISVAQAEDRFQEAFKDYFRLHIERKYGPVSFYSASTLDKISSLKSKGGMPQVNVNPEDGPVFFENYPLKTVLSLLHLYFDKPVSYKRNDDMQIDLTFPIGFERMSMEEKLTFLAGKGILLTMQREEKAYPYISRIN